MTLLLRRLLAWAATPFVVGRDGGWKYGLPDYPPEAVTDKEVLAAIERGRARTNDDVPLRLVTTPAPAKVEED